MLAISTWLWGDKYGVDDVYKLRAGVARHLKQPHRFLVMTERERAWTSPDCIERHAIKDPELLDHPGCLARLRMWDYGWQQNRGVDDRLVCLDLDMVITGPLDKFFDRAEPLVLLRGGNSVNPCPFNGSVIMLRPGHRGDIWTDFSMDAVRKIPFYKFPDDQAWLAHKAPDAASWPCGRKSGIYAFAKPGWPWSNELPANASIVAFPGARSPKDYAHLKWVKENWR